LAFFDKVHKESESKETDFAKGLIMIQSQQMDT